MGTGKENPSALISIKDLATNPESGKNVSTTV